MPVILSRAIRLDAIRIVQTAFEDADVEVLLIQDAASGQLRLVIDLDFGQETNCYCCRPLKEARLRLKTGDVYFYNVLGKMIAELLEHTGRMSTGRK